MLGLLSETAPNEISNHYGQRTSPRDPVFLNQHVDHYYSERLAKECGGVHPMKGQVPSKESVRLRSNDYLCIADHPHFIGAEIDCLRRTGHGDAISRSFLHHYDDPLSRFEHRLAKLLRAEAAVLVNSGYGANVAIIQAIASEGIPVFIDMKAHISLWEGIRSGGGTAVPFRHNDVRHLARMIDLHGPGVVVVDAVYSLDGDICPLQKILDIVEDRECVIVVDETHSFGAMGAGGSGLTVELGFAHRVHFRTIGLSKAVASRGGAIICSHRNAEFLRYESIQAIFSTTVLPHEVAGYNAALDIFANEPWRQERLRQNHCKLHSALDRIGYNVESSKAQIVALDAGDIQTTTKLRDALERRGIFGAIFMPPATPKKRCLMRFTLNCGLQTAELQSVIEACAEIYAELDVASWPSTRRKARGARSRHEAPCVAAASY